MNTNGPGKYDKSLTTAIKLANAEQGILIIIDGDKGPGVAVKAEVDSIKGLPRLLEDLARKIRADNQRNGL